MKMCPSCSGTLESKKVTHHQEYQGSLVLLQNVPAEVCQQCGEVLIRPEILERLQELVWSDSSPDHTTEVPVYDFAKLV